jgi:hypothetical protein
MELFWVCAESWHPAAPRSSEIQGFLPEPLSTTHALKMFMRG